MFKAFLRHNAFGITQRNPHSWHFPFPISLKFLTTTTSASKSKSKSKSNSFAASYFINTLGFSPELALKLSRKVRFKTSQKPNSVLNFFRNHGFTDLDIFNIIKREPWLLSSDPNKRVLPKFQFLISIGASTPDIVRIVGGNPRLMKASLNNRVIPSYKAISQFLKYDHKVLNSIIACPSLLSCQYVASNVKSLVDNGVRNSSIFTILDTRPNIVCNNPSVLEKMVQELKNLGLDPSKFHFCDALRAKFTSKTKWNEKIDTFKQWGWSEETIMEVIRKQPKCMLVSRDKINRVMQFWVNELGWDSSHIVKAPGVLSFSLEKRIIPRASVVHCLLSKGLIKETTSLLSPFSVSDELFLQRYVSCFEEKESSQLLKLYLGKMNVEDQENCDMSPS